MKKLITLLGLISFLCACSHTTPLKAPCNWSGSNCHPQIKINQWDNS